MDSRLSPSQRTHRFPVQGPAVRAWAGRIAGVLLVGGGLAAVIAPAGRAFEDPASEAGSEPDLEVNAAAAAAPAVRIAPLVVTPGRSRHQPPGPFTLPGRYRQVPGTFFPVEEPAPPPVPDLPEVERAVLDADRELRRARTGVRGRRQGKWLWHAVEELLTARRHLVRAREAGEDHAAPEAPGVEIDLVGLLRGRPRRLRFTFPEVERRRAHRAAIRSLRYARAIQEGLPWNRSRRSSVPSARAP